jgi:hypothetical protein
VDDEPGDTVAAPWHRHLSATLARTHAPQVRGGSVTDARSRATRHDRSEKPALLRLRAEGRRENPPAMERVQHARCDSPANCELVQSDAQQLTARNHTVLLPREVRNRLPSPRWQRIVADSATNLCHLARVAGGVLRLGDRCYGWATWGLRRARRPGGRRSARPSRTAVGPAQPRGGRAVRRSGDGRGPARCCPRECRAGSGPGARPGTG